MRSCGVRRATVSHIALQRYKFLLGVVLAGLLIFLPAGTPAFPNGWLLMGLLFVPMFAAGLVLLRKNPALLKSRLQAGETQKEQQSVVRWSGLLFPAAFILAGLNFRFGWHSLSRGAVAAASAVFLGAYLLYGEVLRENTYLSRTVGVQEGQKVIDTGLYAIVRHPMYTATLFLFFSMPLILGSVAAALCLLPYPFLLAKRIRWEETLLKAELPGYEAYTKTVKYRLIPWVW